MDQISSELHGVLIKWKNTQPQKIHNAINMQIMLKLLKEYSLFQALFILFLVLLSDGKYRLNQVCNMNPLMDKLDACIRIPRKLRQSGDTCDH